MTGYDVGMIIGAVGIFVLVNWGTRKIMTRNQPPPEKNSQAISVKEQIAIARQAGTAKGIEMRQNFNKKLSRKQRKR